MPIVTFPTATPWMVTVTKKSTESTMVTARTEKEAKERAEKMSAAGECLEMRTVSKALRARQLSDFEMSKKTKYREARVFDGAPDRDIVEVLRENLSCWMRLRGYTANSLAEKTGIPQKTIWTMVSEKSNTSPSIRTVQKLCDAIGESVIDMLS